MKRRTKTHGLKKRIFESDKLQKSIFKVEILTNFNYFVCFLAAFWRSAVPLYGDDRQSRLLHLTATAPFSVWKELPIAMDVVVYLFKELISAILSVLLLAMFLRAILSWLVDPTGEGKLMTFLYAITEPVIIPVRALCEKNHWFEGMPMDVPFMLSYLLLTLIDLILSLL